MFATVVLQGTGVGSAFIQVPAGWTPINQFNCGTDLLESNSFRISAPPDTSLSPTYTWNFCTDSTCATPLASLGTGSIVAYTDVSTTTPLQTGTGAPECNCHFSTTASANGLTPTVANSLVIAQHASFNNNQLNSPSGFNSIFETSNAPGPDLRQSWQVLPASPTGAVSSTYGTVSPVASDNAGCLVATTPAHP
jgi:hypothetical protein